MGLAKLGNPAQDTARDGLHAKPRILLRLFLANDSQFGCVAAVIPKSFTVDGHAVTDFAVLRPGRSHNGATVCRAKHKNKDRCWQVGIRLPAARHPGHGHLIRCTLASQPACTSQQRDCTPHLSCRASRPRVGSSRPRSWTPALSGLRPPDHALHDHVSGQLRGWGVTQEVSALRIRAQGKSGLGAWVHGWGHAIGFGSENKL